MSMSIQAPSIIIAFISHTRYMVNGVAGEFKQSTNHGLYIFSIHIFYHQLLSISSNQAYQCHNHYICIVFNHIALFISDMRNGEKIVVKSLKSYRGCQKNKTQLSLGMFCDVFNNVLILGYPPVFFNGTPN